MGDIQVVKRSDGWWLHLSADRKYAAIHLDAPRAGSIAEAVLEANKSEKAITLPKGATEV